MYSISFIEKLKMESLCAKSNNIQILSISIAISIFVLLLGTILNIAIWKRNQRTYNFKNHETIIIIFIIGTIFIK